MHGLPITTALCSFGVSGSLFHAPFITANKGFQLYGVWERSKTNAPLKYPGIIVFRSLEALLADQSIELVVVNTPNATHYEYAKKALLAGKHVIVEKPFTIHLAESQELIALATERGKKLSVYQNRRYDSDYRTVKKMVEKGLLGQLVEVEIHYDRYRKWLSPKVHKETAGPGTGSLYDLGSHLIDQALQLFGRPTDVFADLRILRPLSQVTDYFELLLYYPSLRVRLKSSYLVRESLPGYILHGVNGSFIKPKTDVQERDLEAGLMPGVPHWGTEPVAEKGWIHTENHGTIINEPVVSEKGNYGDYYQGVFEAIRHGREVPVTADQGMDVIRVIEAALQSDMQRKLVALHYSSIS